MPARDTVLHPTVLLDEVDAEFHRIRLRFAVSLLDFVGIAWSGRGDGGSEERGQRECCNDGGEMAHAVLLERAE